MVSYQSEFLIFLQSQMGSRASQRSRGAVSKNSYVDETLFGGNKKPGTAASGTGSRAGVPKATYGSAAVISMDELRTIRMKTEKNNQNDAVIISKNDMDRIKEATSIKTKE